MHAADRTKAASRGSGRDESGAEKIAERIVECNANVFV
jgi:hypothetical protein